MRGVRMEAHVATLMVAGVLVLASAVQISATTSTTITPSTATSPSTTTSTARPASTGLEFCDVSQPVHLTAGSQRSSTRLRLTPPAPPRPCRVEVTAPASNDLRFELVPAAPAPVEVEAEAEAQETPDEDDDAYDGRRLEFPLRDRDAAPAPADGDGEVRAAPQWGAAGAAMQAVSLIRQDAARRGRTANASCTLALYVQGELAWAVNLCDPKAVVDANHPDGAFAKMPSGLSLVWTPPRAAQVVRAAALSITAVRKEVPADNLCSVGSVKLAGRGLESAMALELRDGRAPEDRAEPCRVAVEAPGTYLLSLLLVRAAAQPAPSAPVDRSSADSLEANDDPLVDVENTEDAATEDAVPALVRPACGLSVVLGCSSQDTLWSVDLCDPEAAAALNSTELFSNYVTLVWTSPPPNAQRGSPATTPFASSIILTAIGKGATCQSSQFSSCSRRGRYPLCVSRELACDGHHNCPLLGEDEDPNMCNPRHRLIESPGQDKEGSAQRSFPADAKDLLYEFLINQRKQYSPNGSRPETNLQTEPSPDTLSNYGPWGYLMLGMLVCGAFLMLCGLWECCCRQPKPTPAAPSHTPTTVLMPQVGVSGGVLVLDSDLDDDPQRPPSYDDLDQPPAYGALFPPGQPKLDDHPVGAAPAPAPAPTPAQRLATVLAVPLMADAPFPAADADDVPSLHSSPSTSSVTSASSLAPS